VPIRKKGKLPHTTVRSPIRWNTASTRWKMHADAVHPGERVILVDDLIATRRQRGGRGKLLAPDRRQCGGRHAFIVDCPILGGAQIRAMDVPVRTLMFVRGALR
jgi:adenine phosphoribosyltransferase